MGRSLKKGPYVDEKLFAKVNKQIEAGSREPIKTWARRCTIIPEFVGFTFMVHNGKNLIRFSLPRIWLDINWVNFRRRESLKVIQARK